MIGTAPGIDLAVAISAPAIPLGLLPTLLLTWVLAATVGCWLYRRRGVAGIGLVPSYVTNLSLIHLAGAAIYLVDTPRFYSHEEVIMGFREATWGLLAFFSGIAAASLLPPRRIAPAPRPTHPALPRVYLALGLIAFSAAIVVKGTLPSLTSILSAGQYLFLIGLCLFCWEGRRSGRPTIIFLCASVALTLPVVTLLMQGFIGYGVAAAIVTLCFIASMGAPRKRTILVSLVIAYLAASVFVGYLQTRDSVRLLVTQEASVGERSRAAIEAARTFEWFDPGNQVHLDQIDHRLNQNSLVGAAVKRLSTTGDFAEGATLRDAAISLIPRALWPSKPVEAGSGDLASRYTGVTFAEGTSVGIGQILETYANFGTMGVVVGMFLVGIALATIDSRAAYRLKSGDIRGFTTFFLVGIALLQVGGSFVEVAAGAAAAAALALMLNTLLYRLHIGPRTDPDSLPFLASTTEPA